MGSGIALCAAQNGFDVLIYDSKSMMLEKARTSIASNLDFLLKKGKIDAAAQQATNGRIGYVEEIAQCRADLVIEAIIENEEAKISLFGQLAAINDPRCIFASNTSSLSITSLQKYIPVPQRVAGMHFFNPAHVMKLVELVKGEHTSDDVIIALQQVCATLQKTAVVCIDAPGFIVNRVARHYYLEAMKLLEEGVADVSEIDAIMEASGFKMGPFRLMDLIGMDINLAVSESLYEALGRPERLQPSGVQVQKVKGGLLGKKSGEGFYKY